MEVFLRAAEQRTRQRRIARDRRVHVRPGEHAQPAIGESDHVIGGERLEELADKSGRMDEGQDMFASIGIEARDPPPLLGRPVEAAAA